MVWINESNGKYADYLTFDIYLAVYNVPTYLMYDESGVV